eukprot:CAMPEP_0197466536 /NCGR_PEP_ID=MMETSP1175-20131217/65105_1 /TAXON_ID=1003142 /ORGANISM="Triceratium dubium, Strain CCMP147" /LENGTH=829 /DNA_ID=CAMNT_0043002583 /DNA_START=149 /DNA_END=2635 /DNA_ORIENTATION=-
MMEAKKKILARTAAIRSSKAAARAPSPPEIVADEQKSREVLTAKTRILRRSKPLMTGDKASASSARLTERQIHESDRRNFIENSMRSNIVTQQPSNGTDTTNEQVPVTSSDPHADGTNERRWGAFRSGPFSSSTPQTSPDDRSSDTEERLQGDVEHGEPTTDVVFTTATAIAVNPDNVPVAEAIKEASPGCELIFPCCKVRVPVSKKQIGVAVFILGLVVAAVVIVLALSGREDRTPPPPPRHPITQSDGNELAPLFSASPSPSAAPTEEEGGTTPTSSPIVVGAPTFTLSISPTTQASTQSSSATLSTTSSPGLVTGEIPTELVVIESKSAPTGIPAQYLTVAPKSTPNALRPTNLVAYTPTTAPTLMPSLIPTVFPTTEMGSLPTLSPTQVPTNHFTEEPSSMPTSSPTEEPTEAPTNTPTDIPRLGNTNSICASAKITSAEGSRYHHFGESVDVSGGTAVVGEPRDKRDGCESGSAYIFERLELGLGAEWIQRSKLVADDGSCLDGFGKSVAISGDSVIVSAVGDDDRGNHSGGAYVFTRVGTEWVQEAKLVPSDGEEEEWFGNSVAISGDLAVVGAFRDDDSGLWSGSAYVFRREGLTWKEEAKLLPIDGASRHYFGTSVSISGDTILVGAHGHDDSRGAAYIFVHDGGSWTLQARLLPKIRTERSEFGRSVAIEGDVAIVSAFGDSEGRGAGVNVFARIGGVWMEQAKLGDSEGRGAGVNVFARIGGVWMEQAKLLPDDAEAAGPGRFGHSIDLSEGGVVVIGALPPHAVFGSSSAYVFQRTGMTWTQRAKLLSNDGDGFDMFGASVSVDGDFVFVGSHGDRTW